MLLELSKEEIRILTRLVEGELEEISPEIRRSATRRMRVELREDKKHLMEMLTRLHVAEETGVAPSPY